MIKEMEADSLNDFNYFQEKNSVKRKIQKNCYWSKIKSFSNRKLSAISPQYSFQ